MTGSLFASNYLGQKKKGTILENECAMSRDAMQRLPSLEARVAESIQSNEEKDMYIGNNS